MCRLSNRWAVFLILTMSILFGSPGVMMAAEAGNGEPLQLPPWTAIPFGIMLLSIAVLPLLFEHWWHSNRNKLIVVLLLALPCVIYLTAINGDTHGKSLHALGHAMEEYLAFIVLLGALYSISGGIVLRGDIPARPLTNTGFLALGAVLANWIGTTGASMILIRPLLRINNHRKHKSHLPIFFIFVVSNTGGLLTPLGDPPLFLGFLNGVDFFWTMRLWGQWLFVNGLVLAIFWIWDKLAYRKESMLLRGVDEAKVEPIRIEGIVLNGILLAGVLFCVLLQSESFAKQLGMGQLQHPWGELAMLVLSILSLVLTPKRLRVANEFEWGPMIEVAVLFVGIFCTMVPALALLAQHGHKLGIGQPWEYFWLTGILSSFLDNAPTYVTFAALASERHQLGWLMQNKPEILAAISCGAVFMGANTYIGNGPNFMVKAIAEKRGYHMPSFGGYLLYSFGILVPIFILVTVVFF